MSRFLQVLGLVTLAGCQSVADFPPIRTASYVDLERFAGDWYVIASIPTFIEREAFNAIESYEPPMNGKIKTTFTFNKGGFDGEQKTYRPTGFVREDSGNAVWGMQFVWPVKAEYRIVYVDDQYRHTIIGRTRRDYVWLMSRQPSVPDQDYKALLKIIEDEGYDLQKLRLVPHQATE